MALTDRSWKLPHAQGLGSRRHHHEPSRFRCALALLGISAPCTLHASIASKHIPPLTPAGWGEAIVGCCSLLLHAASQRTESQVQAGPTTTARYGAHRMIACVTWASVGVLEAFALNIHSANPPRMASRERRRDSFGSPATHPEHHSRIHLRDGMSSSPRLLWSFQSASSH